MVLNIVCTLININRYFRLILCQFGYWSNMYRCADSKAVPDKEICHTHAGTCIWIPLWREYTICITHIIMTAPWITCSHFCSIRYPSILGRNRETKCLPDTSMTWAGWGGGGGVVTFIMHNTPNNIGGRETHEADRSQWKCYFIVNEFFILS